MVIGKFTNSFCIFIIPSKLWKIQGEEKIWNMLWERWTYFAQECYLVEVFVNDK